MHCPASSRTNTSGSRSRWRPRQRFLYALIALRLTLVYGLSGSSIRAHSEVIMAGWLRRPVRACGRSSATPPGGDLGDRFIAHRHPRLEPPPAGDRICAREVAYRAAAKAQRPETDLSHKRHRGVLFLYNLAGKEFGRYTPSSLPRLSSPATASRFASRCPVGLDLDHGHRPRAANRSRPSSSTAPSSERA